MNWNDLDFTESLEMVFYGAKVIRLQLPLPAMGLTDSQDLQVAVGVDPGVNFAVAEIIPDYAITVWYGRLAKIPLPKQERWEYGIHAREAVHTLLPTPSEESPEMPAIPATVEGAAYGKTKAFGQVGLAEARFGFCEGLKEMGYAVRVIPPQTIRARIMSKEEYKTLGGMFGFWSDMNHNAADAIGAALYASGYRGPGR